MNPPPNSGPANGSDPPAVPVGSSDAEERVHSGKQVDPRMHSSEHILTATMIELFGCGRPFTTHLEKKKSKADYRFERNLTPEETHRVESRVNQVIAKNLPVWEEYLSRAQAQQAYDLARLPEGAGEKIRIVHIGDYDACPCSGAHVATTGRIGRFRIISTSNESGALRIRFKLDPGF